MTRAKRFKAVRTAADVRALALRYPGVEESSACVNAAFKAGKKTFVFLGVKNDTWHVKVKLSDSVPEAEDLAAAHPAVYATGKFGWTDARFAAGVKPPADLLARWIDESYRLLAPKALVAQLPDAG